MALSVTNEGSRQLVPLPRSHASILRCTYAHACASAQPPARLSREGTYDAELVANPPMPFRIGKVPPAPTKIRPASKGRARWRASHAMSTLWRARRPGWCVSGKKKKKKQAI